VKLVYRWINNGDLTSAQAGYAGGYMVKKMIEAQEYQMANYN